MFYGRFLKLCAIFVFCWALCATVPVFADDELAASMEVGTWTTNPRFLTFGSYNGHDLKWRVLEVYSDKTAFLVLDGVLRNADGTPYERRFDNYDNNFPGGENCSPVSSDICTWLNDADGTEVYYDGQMGFFFSAGLKDYDGDILETTYGPEPHWSYSWANGVTEGTSKIFLLSVEEATNPQYFVAGEKMDDSYTFSANADRDVGFDFWLRSPGDYNSYAAVVWSGGQVISLGLGVSELCAVRPALKINLTSPVFTSTSVLVAYP
jgi:hypothetical protein